MEVGNTFGIICVDIKSEKSTLAAGHRVIYWFCFCFSQRHKQMSQENLFDSHVQQKKPIRPRLLCAEQIFSFLPSNASDIFSEALWRKLFIPLRKGIVNNGSSQSVELFQLLVLTSLLRLHFETDAGSE